MIYGPIAPPREMSPEEMKLAAHLVDQIWASVLCGSQTQFQRDMFDRMSHPVRGDLVVESTTLAFRPGFEGQFVRYLYLDRRPWEYDDGELGGMTDYHICLKPDGDEIEWTNCRLMAVPEGSWEIR